VPVSRVRTPSVARTAGAFALGTASGVALTPVLAYAAYAVPAAVWLGPVRRRLVPRLAGIGPDPSHVALTFDDGPDPHGTPAVLDALDRLGWKATFFLLGSMTAADPGLAAEVAAAGHEVAVHAYEHASALRRSPGRLVDDLVRARDVVARATGADLRWYRPPYGQVSAGVFVAARQAGLQPVLWSAWGRDWRKQATPASVVNDLSRGVLRGGTILLHDSDCTSSPGSWRTTAASLPLLAGQLELLGVRPGPLGEHGLAA